MDETTGDGGCTWCGGSARWVVGVQAQRSLACGRHVAAVMDSLVGPSSATEVTVHRAYVHEPPAELPSLFRPVEIDYAGTDPHGDHIALRAAAWADVCWVVGAASVTVTGPVMERVERELVADHPLVRFPVASVEVPGA